MDIYSLSEGKFIPQLNSVDNSFIRQIFMLALNSAKNKKMLGIAVNNSGKKDNENYISLGQGVINICQLTPLKDKENCKTLVEDIAKYRWETLDLGEKDYWKERSNLLFLDYILASCLCYVEVSEAGFLNGSRTNLVDKFYATRNRFVAANVAGLSAGETGKYVNYLTPIMSDYKIESLRVLKLSKQKKGFKITQPRSAINFKKTVRVTPLFFIDAFLQGITPILKENIVKFTYIKDNGQSRELTTTLSRDIIKKYYSEEYADNILKNCAMKLDRGYLRVPELGGSIYDATGLRALNLSRITSMEIVDSFDTSFINVDFNSIVPTFKATIDAIKDIRVMTIIYQDIMGEVPDEKKSLMELRSDIQIYVDGRFAIGTTTFQKELHKFMLKYNKVVFKGYTGEPNTISQSSEDDFNMGFE